MARERSVPAFVIFSDKTLIQMANDVPLTENEFLAISGVGRSKFEEYYYPFKEVLSKFRK